MKNKDKEKSVIDTDNVFNSIYKSKDLFKKLSLSCHPDRHQNSESYIEIQKFYQEITKDKYNYNNLVKHKETAELIYKIKIY
jgi:hypothetical protein